MLHPASENRTGNDRFHGYAIDLIGALATLCKFNYTFYISPDRKYGSRQPDGKWNGMVGELIQRVSITTIAFKSLYSIHNIFVEDRLKSHLITC